KPRVRAMTEMGQGVKLAEERITLASSTASSATAPLPADPRPKLLFLCHRIPFPPDKGEKIRAFRILEHLSRAYRISLGCFVDDPQDWITADQLKPYCDELKCIDLRPQFTKLRALGGLLTGAPLTVASFANAALAAWVSEHLAREKPDVV